MIIANIAIIPIRSDEEEVILPAILLENLLDREEVCRLLLSNDEAGVH